MSERAVRESEEIRVRVDATLCEGGRGVKAGRAVVCRVIDRADAAVGLLAGTATGHGRIASTINVLFDTLADVGFPIPQRIATVCWPAETFWTTQVNDRVSQQNCG